MCNVYNIGDNKKSLVMSVYCTACVALRVRCTSHSLVDGRIIFYKPRRQRFSLRSAYSAFSSC